MGKSLERKLRFGMLMLSQSAPAAGLHDVNREVLPRSLPRDL